MKLSAKIRVFISVCAAAVLFSCGVDALDYDNLVTVPDIVGIEIHSREKLDKALASASNANVYAVIQDAEPFDIDGIAIPAGFTINLYGNFALTRNHVWVGGILCVAKGSSLAIDDDHNLMIGIPSLVGTDAKVQNACGLVVVNMGGALELAAIENIKFARYDTTIADPKAPVECTIAALQSAAGSGVIEGSGPIDLVGKLADAAKDAMLVFKYDSILKSSPGTSIPANYGNYLIALANARFLIPNLQTSLVGTVNNLTIRKGTALTATGELKFKGKLAVYGSLAAESSGEDDPDWTELIVHEGAVAKFGDKTHFSNLEVLRVDGTLVTGNGAYFGTLFFGGSATGTGTLDLTAVTPGYTLDEYQALVGIQNVKASMIRPGIKTEHLVIPEGNELTLSRSSEPLGSIAVDGTLTLLSDAAITIAETKTMRIGSAGKLALCGGPSGAEIKGSGKVVAGTTTITGGGANDGWRAIGDSDGMVVITAPAGEAFILASGEGALATMWLCAFGSAGTALISVVASESDTTLTIGGSGLPMALDVSAIDETEAGGIRLQGYETSVALLRLKGLESLSAATGLLKINNGSDTASGSGNYDILSSAGKTAALRKNNKDTPAALDDLTVKTDGADISSPQLLVSVAGKLLTDAVIVSNTAASEAITIKGGATICGKGA
jgi:hypothetical protein